MEESEEINKLKSYNVKLFPYYKMVSWDLLFFYALSFMFLTTIKHFSAADVIFVESLYIAFKVIFQVFGAVIADKFGNRKSLIIANSCITIYVFLMIIAPNMQTIIISRMFCAIGFVIKGICEHNMLYSSLSHTDDRSKKFAQVDGRSSSLYYVLESISSCIAGFLFIINPYFPMFLCLLCCILSIILAYKFKESSVENVISQKSKFSFDSVKTYFKDLKLSFRYIIKSNRLRSLILFCGIFCSVLQLLVSLRSSLLKDINFPPQYMGIALAILGLFSAFSSSRQNVFNKRFGNKLLNRLATFTLISTFLCGFIVILGLPKNLMTIIILLMFTIQFITKGAYATLSKKYLSSFSTSALRSKIYTANNLFESICGTLSSLLVSFLLSVTNTAYTMIIVSILFGIIISFVLNYMKTRLGLKPEEYKRSDIPIEIK